MRYCATLLALVFVLSLPVFGDDKQEFEALVAAIRTAERTSSQEDYKSAAKRCKSFLRNRIHPGSNYWPVMAFYTGYQFERAGKLEVAEEYYNDALNHHNISNVEIKGRSLEPLLKGRLFEVSLAIEKKKQGYFANTDLGSGERPELEGLEFYFRGLYEGR